MPSSEFSRIPSGVNFLCLGTDTSSRPSIWMNFTNDKWISENELLLSGLLNITIKVGIIHYSKSQRAIICGISVVFRCFRPWSFRLRTFVLHVLAWATFQQLFISNGRGLYSTPIYQSLNFYPLPYYNVSLGSCINFPWNCSQFLQTKEEKNSTRQYG